MGLTRDQILANLRSESIGVESVPIAAAMKFDDNPIRSLYCEGAGTVTFIGLQGVVDTWSVPDNYTIPIAMSEITEFTATGLHGIR